jgi:hypothetical protein
MSLLHPLLKNVIILFISRYQLPGAQSSKNELRFARARHFAYDVRPDATGHECDLVRDLHKTRLGDRYVLHEPLQGSLSALYARALKVYDVLW